MDWLLAALEKMEVGTVLAIFVGFFLYDRFIITKRFEKIDSRFEKIEQQFSLINGRFDIIEKRIYALDAKLYAIEIVLSIIG